MYLVKFLEYGVILSIIPGQLGHFPFGASWGINLSDIFLILLVLFFTIWLVETKTKVQIPPIFKIIILFWLIGIISLLFSLTFLPWIEVLKGSLYLLRFIFYSLILLINYHLVKSKVLNQDSLILFLIIAGLGIFFLGLIQLIFLPNFESSFITLTEFGFDPHQGRLSSSFLDPNFTGSFLVLTLALIFYQVLKSFKVKWISLFLLIFLGIILTYSRSAYLMLLIFLLSLGLSLRKKIGTKMLILLAVILIFVGISINLFLPRVKERIIGGLLIDGAAQLRMISWEKGFLVFQKSPIVGVGFDNLRAAFAKFNLLDSNSLDGGHSGAGVDSGLVFLLTTTGILGTLVFIFFWRKVFLILSQKKNIFSIILTCLLIALLIDGQFINSLFYSPVMIWYFSLLGSEI